MPATGPGDKPNRPRRARRQPKPPSAAQVQQAAAGAQPLSARPVRPTPPRPTPRQVQRVAQNARPLSQRPTHPKQVVRPLSPKPPRRVTTAAPSKLDVHTDVPTAQRQAAVHVYDQLSHREKRARVREARQKIKAGHADTSDHAILHIHNSRVQGKRNRVALVRSYEAIGGRQSDIDALTVAAQNIRDEPTNAPSTGMASRSGHLSLNLQPGYTYGPEDKKGSRQILDRGGKNVGVVAPYRGPAGRTVANLPSVGKLVAAAGPLSTQGLKSAHVPKVIANIPADLAENVITSPSSVAKFVTTAAKHPGQAGRALVKPYQQLAHDPKKFVQQRPVTTALMLDPLRVPGRAAGRTLRLAGKQTLKRPAATLEHTALREARTGSRSAVRRAVQARRDAKAPPPSVTSRQIDTRVDEAFAAGQKHAERVRNHILHDAHQEAKKLPKADRAAHMEAATDRARKAVVATKRTHYALEFGATPRVESGRVVEQPDATTGHLHDTFEEAKQVRDHLNAKAQMIERGPGSVFEGGIGAKLNSKDAVRVEYRVVDAGHGKFAVMPSQAGSRITLHSKIGRDKSVPAVMLRQTRRMLSKAVLPYHPTWLSGQAIEGTVRSAIAGAGPTSWMRAHRLQARHPDLYKALQERAIPGGQLGRTVATEMTHRTLAQEIPDSLVARRFTEYGQKPGIKQARALNDALTNVIFEKLNGRLLEGTPQKAMLGRALKQSPLMERSTIGLANKAIDEAARGVDNLETKVALARDVTRDFGKYAGFSPRLRSFIMHWTPFIPWYINTARFLLQTLPRDHPLATGLVADINTAEEDWRKQQGLSLRYQGPNSLPPWMLGGYPIQGGKNLVRLGHYTPAGVDPDIAGSASGLLLPQFAGAYGAMKYGKDWKGADLKHADGSPYNQGERAVYAAAQLIESLTPGTAQAAQVLHAPEVLGGPSDTDTSTLKQRVLKQVRPISTTPIHHQQQGTGVHVTPVKVKPVHVRTVKVGSG